MGGELLCRESVPRRSICSVNIGCTRNTAVDFFWELNGIGKPVFPGILNVVIWVLNIEIITTARALFLEQGAYNLRPVFLHVFLFLPPSKVRLSLRSITWAETLCTPSPNTESIGQSKTWSAMKRAYTQYPYLSMARSYKFCVASRDETEGHGYMSWDMVWPVSAFFLCSHLPFDYFKNRGRYTRLHNVYLRALCHVRNRTLQWAFFFLTFRRYSAFCYWAMPQSV